MKHSLSADRVRNRDEQASRKGRVLHALEAQPFRPPWWLRNGHAQTVWAPIFRNAPRVNRRVETVNTPDDDFIRLHRTDGVPGKPVVLMLHGLEGSADSAYIRGLTSKLQAIGWATVTIEHRGCGGEMNRARRLYHSGETTDLAFAASRLAREFEQVYIAGFSLGGNMLAKWLGETELPNVRGAAVISAPYDLTVSGPNIDRVLAGLYSRHFLRSLVKKAEAKERQFPGCVDIQRVRAAKTLREFDNDATAALHGFRDVDHYYETQGCGQFLKDIRVPTLLLSSADDPFNPPETLPRAVAEASPWLHPQFTDAGGHVGFVYGSPGRASYWAEEQIVRFFECYATMDAAL